MGVTGSSLFAEGAAVGFELWLWWRYEGNAQRVRMITTKGYGILEEEQLASARQSRAIRRIEWEAAEWAA